MKRLLATIVLLALLITSIPITVTAQTSKAIRVVIDGEVHQVKARLYSDEWYLKPADIKTLLGSKASVTPLKSGYASLRNAVKSLNFNYEHDAILGAAYIRTDETYSENGNNDYDRGITLGLLSDALKKKPDAAITPKEFGDVLMLVLKKTAPQTIAKFKKNVAPALKSDKKMYRGEGFVMAYYAAECLGINTRNNSFDHMIIPTDVFWSTDRCDLDHLYPYLWNGPVSWGEDWDPWGNYFIAAYLWSMWYSSPRSGVQVFEYDKASNSMRQSEVLTVREAVCAAVRIYDGFQPGVEYALVSNQAALNYDKSILTDTLLTKAKALPKIDPVNPPIWRGFILSNNGSYESRDIIYSENDLRNISNWGFNSFRLMITYQTLFDAKAQKVNLTNLKKLDNMVALAIKYNLHMDLLTFSLPGRWTSFDFNTYESQASLDLFTNPERQKEANAVWALLAQRYQDVPSATLSFCPLWEAQNYSLSTGMEVPPYTAEDVEAVYSQLIKTIRDQDPDRFVIYEPTPTNYANDVINQAAIIKERVEEKYSGVLMMTNFCEIPLVYAEMTAVQGAHIDHQNHSMFKPEYPVTIYASQYHIDNGAPLELNGDLPAGTKLELYLSATEGNGILDISADGTSLYNEPLSSARYTTGTPLSGLYPFAKSDKLITITLPKKVDKLQISYSGYWFEWSGINVILPKEYAVSRWWFMSGYDALLEGVERSLPQLKPTSTVMLCPNSYDKGRVITINRDISYRSDTIAGQSNLQTIQNWAKTMKEFSPNMITRFENVSFNLGCVHSSALAYYKDLISTLDQYGFGWYSNDYDAMIKGGNYEKSYAVPYKSLNLDVAMLQLFQKYQ